MLRRSRKDVGRTVEEESEHPSVLYSAEDEFAEFVSVQAAEYFIATDLPLQRCSEGPHGEAPPEGAGPPGPSGGRTLKTIPDRWLTLLRLGYSPSGWS